MNKKWTIKEDIATYSSDDFSMICKIKIIAKGCGVYEVDTETIYMDEIKNPILPARAMRELGEHIQSIGYDKFNIYKECEYCGELFIPKQKNSMYCSKKCKVAAHRLSKSIEKGSWQDDEIFVFNGGNIETGIYYDTINLKDCSVKVMMINLNEADEDEIEEYHQIKSQHKDYYEEVCDDEVVILFDRTGDIHYKRFLFVYEKFLNIL
jgi:hypothetical protein